MGGPGDDATVDESIAPPLPRDRARAPRCSFRRNAPPPSKASQPSSRCWNTQHVPEIGGDYDAAGIETGLDGERLGSRELWTTITVAALRPAGHPGAYPLRPAPPAASTTSRRARAAPSTRPRGADARSRGTGSGTDVRECRRFPSQIKTSLTRPSRLSRVPRRTRRQALRACLRAKGHETLA